MKAQEEWSIEGGNAVEPRIIKRIIRTAITVTKSNNISKGMYQFNQTNTKTDLSMRRNFDVTGIVYYNTCINFDQSLINIRSKYTS